MSAGRLTINNEETMNKCAHTNHQQNNILLWADIFVVPSYSGACSDGVVLSK